MQDKLDELHYIYKLIGNYGFCTVQELLDRYNLLKETNEKTKKYVSSLSSKGRGCEIYADIKKNILDILKEVK